MAVGMKALRRVSKTNKDKHIKQLARLEAKKVISSGENVEIKRHRFIHNAALVAGTSVYNNLLTANLQGDDDLNNHIGDRIKLTDVRINMCIAPSAANEIVRVLLFYWKPLNSTAPTDADILDDTTNSITMLLGEVDFDAKKSKNVFTVIYDRFLMVSSVEGPKTIAIRKKLNRNVQFDATTSNALGAPYLLLLSNSTPTIRAYSVVRYTDL